MFSLLIPCEWGLLTDNNMDFFVFFFVLCWVKWNYVQILVFLHLHNFINLWLTLVLFYAAGVWCFEEVFDCNSVQNSALRCFLGVHKYAHHIDAGWDPCIVKQRCEMVRLWNRLVRLREERLTRKKCNWDIAKHHPWSIEVSLILSACDLHIMYWNNLQCNINVVRQRLFRNCLWRSMETGYLEV